jgi:dienelactone hydrolase
MVNFLATRAPELAAGVPFYGGQPPAASPVVEALGSAERGAE